MTPTQLAAMADDDLDVKLNADVLERILRDVEAMEIEEAEEPERFDGRDLNDPNWR